MCPHTISLCLEGSREGRAGQLQGLAPGKARVEVQEQLPSCSWRLRLSWNQLRAPKRPCLRPGLGAVSVSILISQGDQLGSEVILV